MFNKIVMLLVLMVVGVLVFIIQIEQIRKAQNALTIIKTCPTGANLMVEVSTPVFGEGLKATCIYSVGQLYFDKQSIEVL